MKAIASDEQIKHWAKQLTPNSKPTYGELERENAELKQQITLLSGVFSREEELQSHIAELKRINNESKKHNFIKEWDKCNAVICANCGAIYWEKVSECDCQVNVETKWKSAIVYHEPMSNELKDTK